jgi:hypothetical protein
MLNRTADEYREMAAGSRRTRQDSIDRNGGDIDTENCVTTFCGDLNARLYDYKAELVDAGGVAEFPGLFDRETGARVRAKLIEQPNEPWNGLYGDYWMFVDADGKPTGRFLTDSKGTKRSKMYREGFEKRMELAPADAKIAGSGTGLSGLSTCYITKYRTDDGYPADAEVR